MERSLLRWSRLALGLVAVCVVATPAFAQIQMPSAKEMSGIPRPVDDVPDGTIVVRLVRGELSNNITSHPVELHGAGRVLTARTDENGRATFTGVPAGTTVRAVATVDTERLESEQFPMVQRGGIRLMLVATPQGEGQAGGAAGGAMPAQPGVVVLGNEARVFVEVADEAVQVYHIYDLVNSARAPVATKEPLVFQMPEAARQTTVLESSSRQATARGLQVIVNGPFRPGATPIHFAYSMPYSSGTLALSHGIPAAMPQVAVAVSKVGDVHFSSPQLGEHRQVDAEGRTYIMAHGGGVAAGGTLSIELTGLPHHGAAPRWIALVLAFLIIGTGVWAAVPPKETRSAAGRQKQLVARREKLFAELVKIEGQWRAGRVDRARYTTRRHDLIAQLERIYGELDHEWAPDAPSQHQALRAQSV